MDPSVSYIFIGCNIMLNCSMGYYKCAVTEQDQSWNILYTGFQMREGVGIKNQLEVFTGFRGRNRRGDNINEGQKGTSMSSADDPRSFSGKYV